MSNAASVDGSAPECAIYFDQPTYLMQLPPLHHLGDQHA